MFSDNLIARTVIAKRFTKWNVHIEGQWQRLGIRANASLLQSEDIVILTKRFYEAIRRRVGRIARPGNVELTDEFGGNNRHSEFHRFVYYFAAPVQECP
ncbi:hypothetical protein SDC9_93047 [bioreactor metagenome]|uniref:Uncharacterized protein n=1 Tax=bioreactor metagenome TaxID=1076179 RepID=A0A644ZZE5_9ZZZZ